MWDLIRFLHQELDLDENDLYARLSQTDKYFVWLKIGRAHV